MLSGFYKDITFFHFFGLPFCTGFLKTVLIVVRYLTLILFSSFLPIHIYDCGCAEISIISL